MAVTTIRPGLLVACKSSIEGGVSYQRTDLETGRQLAKWETTRVIDNPDEHERARVARGRALTTIRAACAPTSFGLLCPTDREVELDAAVAAAQAIVAEYNATAVHSTVSVFVLKGRIASTDEEAARAIGAEVAGLIGEMSAGVDRLNPAAIRDAANKARKIAAVLGDEQIKAVSSAVEAARKAARAIVKRVEKEGEDAAQVLAEIKQGCSGAIDTARIAFLDLSPESEAQTEHATLPAVNVQRFADVLDGELPPPVETSEAPTPASAVA